MTDTTATLRLIVQEEVSTRLKKVQTQMDQLNGRSQGMRNGLNGLFAQFGAGSVLTLGAGAALGVFGAKSVQAAAALETLDRRAGAVYGDSLPGVRSEIEAIAASVNRSTSDLLNYSTAFATVAQGADLTTTAATGLSTSLAELTADLSSFYGITDDEAFQALQGGLLGNARALRQMGVVMTDSTLQAFALSNGIKKNVADMSEGQQMALRYGFIMESTQRVQGDAARNTEGFSNQVARLKGVWGDFLEEAGKPILPVLARGLGIVAVAAEGATEAIAGMTGTVRALAAEVESYFGSLEGGYFDYVRDNANQIFGTKPILPDDALHGIDLAASGLAGVNFEAKKGQDDWKDWWKTAGGGGGGGGKEAEDRLKKVKDAMADVGKSYTDTSRTIVQRLVELDSAHREKMKGITDEIDKVTDALTRLDREYDRTTGKLTSKEADTVAGQEERVRLLEESFKLAVEQGRQWGFVEDQIGKIMGNRNEADRGRAITFQERMDNRYTDEQVELLNKAIELDKERKALEAYRSSGNTVSAGDLSAGRERTASSQFTLDVAGIREQRDDEADRYKERKDDLEDELRILNQKKTDEVTAYTTQRTQLQLTQAAMSQFHADYSAKMADLSKVTDETVAGMNAKLEELRNVISSIDSLLQANAGITGGETLEERSAARGAKRLSAVPFADGGIVTKPTLALIGEAGREAVIPLDKGGFGPMSLTFGDIVIQGANSNPRELAQEVIRIVVREIQKVPLAAA